MTQLEINIGKKVVKLYFGYMLESMKRRLELFLSSSACCCHCWAACSVFGLLISIGVAFCAF